MTVNGFEITCFKFCWHLTRVQGSYAGRSCLTSSFLIISLICSCKHLEILKFKGHSSFWLLNNRNARYLSGLVPIWCFSPRLIRELLLMFSEFKYNILQWFHREFLLFWYDHYWLTFYMNNPVEFNREMLRHKTATLKYLILNIKHLIWSIQSTKQERVESN